MEIIGKEMLASIFEPANGKNAKKMQRVSFNLKVGEQICNLRKSHKESMKNLADAIGVSVLAVNNWEKGKTQISLNDAQKIVDHYGTSIRVLLGGQVEKTVEIYGFISSLELLLNLLNDTDYSITYKKQPISTEQRKVLKEAIMLLMNPAN